MNQKKIPGMNATPILQYSQCLNLLEDTIYRHAPAIATLHGNLRLADAIAKDITNRISCRNRHGIIVKDTDLCACHADFYIVLSSKEAAETSALAANYFGKNPDCAILFGCKKELEEILLRNREELSNGLYAAVVAFDLEGR